MFNLGRIDVFFFFFLGSYQSSKGYIALKQELRSQTKTNTTVQGSGSQINYPAHPASHKEACHIIRIVFF